MPLKLSDPIRFMIFVLREFDLFFVRNLFKKTFDESEYTYFKDAWNNRTREHSVGVWYYGTLMGAAIVCNNKLEYIFVDPNYQGKGYGTQLINYVLSQCPTLYLNPADDPKLCEWYERLGFQLSNEVSYPTYTKRCYARHDHFTRSKAKTLCDKIEMK